MLMIPRLDRAENVDRGDIRAGESSIVHDLFDARPGRSDLRGEIGEAARAVADHSRESAQSAVGDEATFDHATEDVGIDVAAAKQKDYSLIREIF